MIGHIWQRSLEIIELMAQGFRVKKKRSSFAKASDFVRRSGLRPAKSEDGGGGEFNPYDSWLKKEGETGRVGEGENLICGNPCSLW